MLFGRPLVYATKKVLVLVLNTRLAHEESRIPSTRTTCKKAKLDEKLVLKKVLISSLLIMRPSSLGGGRILRRTLSVRLSVCPSVPLSLPSVTSFRQPLASRMYFSARTEGSISYGHLGRTQHFFPQNCSGLINIHDLVSQSGNRCSAVAAAQKALIGH